MKEVLDRLVGEVPVAGFEDLNSIQGNSEMLVVIPKFGIDLPYGQHAHAGYEFIIPSRSGNSIRIEKHVLVTDKDYIVPMNSGQFHGPGRPQQRFYSTCLSVDDRLMNQVARDVFGKRDVCFSNTTTKTDFNLWALIHLFIGEARHKQTGYRFVLENLSRQIIVYLLRTTKNNVQNAAAAPPQRSRTGRGDLLKAEEYLRENYNADFSMEDVAREIGFHPHYFIRLFKAHTGKSPYDYFLDIKIEKARQLLSDPNLSITEVCISAGFNNPSHFATVFKRKVGMTPSQYRRAL